MNIGSQYKGHLLFMTFIPARFGGYDSERYCSSNTSY